MQRLEVSGAVRPIYGSLGVKRLICSYKHHFFWNYRHFERFDMHLGLVGIGISYRWKHCHSFVHPARVKFGAESVSGTLSVAIWLLTINIPPQSHHMFLWTFFPPGCGDSVADFWGWDAHEARLRCPDDVSGDMQEDEILRRALSLNLLTTQTMVTTGIFPCKEKFPW